MFFDIGFDIHVLLYFIAGTFGPILIDSIICYIAIKHTKNKYYVINTDGIRYYDTKEITFIKRNEITEIDYISKWYILLMQIGSGCLKIKIKNHSHDLISIAYANIYDKNTNTAYILLFTTKKMRNKIIEMLK